MNKCKSTFAYSYIYINMSFYKGSFPHPFLVQRKYMSFAMLRRNMCFRSFSVSFTLVWMHVPACKSGTSNFATSAPQPINPNKTHVVL